MDALKDFEGTMIFLSYDRMFLRGLGSRVLELGGESGTDRHPTFYPGTYVEYVQKLGHEAPGIYSLGLVWRGYVHLCPPYFRCSPLHFSCLKRKPPVSLSTSCQTLPTSFNSSSRSLTRRLKFSRTTARSVASKNST